MNLMKKYQIKCFFLFLFLYIIKSGYAQELNDSIKIDEQYQLKRYAYFDDDSKIYQTLDTSRELQQVGYILKIDSIKRLYKVLKIYSFVNINGTKYNLFEITDYSNKWVWTLISESEFCICKEKIKLNGLYYMTIYYFEGEENISRLPFDSEVWLNFNGNIICVDSYTYKTRMVYSPNIKGRCFIP